MNLEKLLHLIKSELSGERTKKTTGILSQYHRIQASKEFLSAIGYVKAELESLGDNNGLIHEYIADGTKRYYNWNTPISWDIQDGELIVIEPTNEILCRYSEIPESVCTHSKPVDIIAEVIHIGEGSQDDFKDKDVEGKIVLTTGSPRSMIKELAERGAIGIIAYPSEQRAQGYLHMIQYVGLWPNAETIDESTFGFSLSRKQALELLNYMKEEKKVIVQAKIQAKLYEGKMHVLSTKIEGTGKPDEEIILIAHICHPAPSANDNASGSALLLEIYRLIASLIKQGKIEKPHRTLRFLWVPEFHGTIPWIKEQTQNESFKPIFCINLDMVGEHPAIVGYPFTFNKASISTPSYLNDLIVEIINLVKDNPDMVEQGGWLFPWNYRIKPFAGGSDHLLFNDEPTRIPSVMFGHPDTFHHTNLDTIEKVDPTTLKRVGAVAAATAIASAYENQFSTDIIMALMKGFQYRKSQITELIVKEYSHIETIVEKERKVSRYLLRSIIHKFVNNERIILDTIIDSFPNVDKKCVNFIESELKLLHQTISELMPSQSNIEIDVKTKEILCKVPKRKWKGPLNIQLISNIEKIEQENENVSQMNQEQLQRTKDFVKKSQINYGGRLLEFVNLINDENSIEDIISSLSLVDLKIPELQIILDVLEMIEHLNLIEIKE